LRKRGGDKMLDRPTKNNAVPTNELYTLLALLHYVRRELGSLYEFAEYFVDMAIYQLSQRLPTNPPDPHRGRDSVSRED
jgi:hypothetical protein